MDLLLTIRAAEQSAGHRDHAGDQCGVAIDNGAASIDEIAAR
jgi:hypothetical protein